MGREATPLDSPAVAADPESSDVRTRRIAS
jgi:hypothetical protein